MTYLGLGEASMDMSGAPSKADFLKVFAEVHKGVSPSAGIPNVGRANNMWRMVYCLAGKEGRTCFRQRTILRMVRDERAGRLSIRLAGATPCLRRGAMAVGIAKGHGAGADAITKATMDLFTRFANPGYNCTLPGITKKCDSDLLPHHRSSLKQVITDAASDERLPARQLIEGIDFS